MKLKRLPDDFQVTELTGFRAERGDFALYQLCKRSIGTLESIEAIQQRWNIARQRLSWGGLKDRHAVTEQFVTIHRGPRRNLRESAFELRWIGDAPRPFTPADIAGNRFRVVMRDMTPDEAGRAATALEEVKGDGLPNYFDDQRFGSVGESGEFIGRAWCAGDYERAMWLALAEPHADDRPDEREEKRILREHWGRWRECKAALGRSHRRSVVTYLADRPPDAPSDFRGAFARIRVDLRGLYLSAFQSSLWNRMLDEYLRSRIPPEQTFDVPLQLGPVPFFRGLERRLQAELRSTRLPLPSARLHLEEGPTLELIQRVLARDKLELREIRVKYPRDSFFSKGERSVLVEPAGLAAETADDELYAGRKKMTLRFELPRGVYATILVKRLTGQNLPEVEHEESDDEAGISS